MASLVRDVIEHHSFTSAGHQPKIPVRPGESSKTGFPIVQHRSKATSAFKRARQDERVQSELSDSKVILASVSKARNERAWAGEQKARLEEDWMADVSRSNTETVENMSAQERERERDDIIDRFGTGIDDLFLKVREARKRRAVRESEETVDAAQDKADYTVAPDSVPPSPRARAARKIRFVEPTEADVHVYESQPSSPKRTVALLPPPPDDSLERRGISSLGNFKGFLKPQGTSGHVHVASSPPERGAEEGTPEDIRRRFFPSEVRPEANPALAWMLPSSSKSPLPGPNVSPSQNPDDSSGACSANEPRYTLSGSRLSSSQIENLPTHLGLHHHASTTSSASVDTPAGYTLPDLLLLARSSVPAQRASILGVLANILRVAREQAYVRGRETSLSSSPGTQEGSQGAAEGGHDIDLLRRDVLDAAIDALGEKGGVGQRAVDLLWEAVVACTFADFSVTDLDNIVGVDLTPGPLPAPSMLACSKPSYKLATTMPVSNFSKSWTSVLLSLPLNTLLPALKSHLIAFPSPLSRTHSEVLDILLVLSQFTRHARTIVSLDAGAGVIAAMMEPHLRSSFGFDDEEEEESHVTITAIRILQVLARSDRDTASKLTGPADILLRYLTSPLPSLNSIRPQADCRVRLALTLIEETLRFYMILSQYGLYAQVATTAQEYFGHIGTWLTACSSVIDPAMTSLSCAYLGFLETLIVCATDPHRTTPSHDILWSQVQGWGWGERIMDFVTLASESPSFPSHLGVVQHERTIEGLWTSICHTTAAWVEGASVNGVKGGEGERAVTRARLKPHFDTERGAWRAVRAAIAALRVWQFPSSLDVQAIRGLRQLAEAASLVAAILRLALACFEPGLGEQSFFLPEEDIWEVCVRFAGGTSACGPFDLVFNKRNEATSPEYVHAFLRPISTLLVLQLRLWRRSMAIPVVGVLEDVAARDKEWTKQALHVLGILLPGDEGYAKWIVESLCDRIDRAFIQKILPSVDTPREIWDKDGMKILLPFLIHSLRPAAMHGEESQNQPYIAPISPNSESIARCTTLNLPSLSKLRHRESNGEGLILPLRNDWPTWPLNHLLRSGTSSVFHTLPPSWDASETDVIRASLLLVRIVQEVVGRVNIYPQRRRLAMSRTEMVFACMKVFMLEHGQQHVDSGEEVFRDSWVTRWMEDLLKPFTYAEVCSYRSTEEPRSLELVSKPFLGEGIPFYQFYNDFVALYDAISFSHPIFGRLLLPPVSMSYPIDYRKLLFGDFGHIVRTVKTDIQDVLCEDVRDYLWPVEHDVHVIGWHLKTIVTSDVRGFLRWVAVHHVAANIWPEFSGDGTGDHERAKMLLSAMLQQGNKEIIKEVALYRQLEDEVWLPPRCFMAGEIAWRQRRLDWAGTIGERAKTQLQSMLID